MEERILKLMSYFGLLAVIVYAFATATGKGDQLQKKPAPCSRQKGADGSIWARNNVPTATMQQPAGVGPQVRY